MKTFYKNMSVLFAMMACIGLFFDASASAVSAICAVAIAVLSVGEDA